MRKATMMRMLAAGMLLLMPVTADAQVRIAKGTSGKMLVDISGIETAPGTPREFMQVLRGNLDRSGWLHTAPAAEAMFRATGRTRLERNQLRVDISVVAAGSSRAVFSRSYREPPDAARRLAQMVTDAIVEALTEHPGIATTRIAMVGTRSGHKELYLCDADGGNLIQLTRDRSIVVRPRWDFQGNRITYTGYMMRFPDIYLVDLSSGRRSRVSRQAGLNAGGALAPNGRDMALILSKDGNPELYVKNLENARLTRLTHTPRAVEGSPSWSPDGRQIVYVSDPAGRPHLYIISREGGSPRRLTTRGSENVSPDWGPQGWIAYASRVGGRYQIALIQPETGENRYLALDGADYEDPSWARNGRHLVCSRTIGGRSQVILLDTMDETWIPLTAVDGNWYSPAWSPR